MTRSRPFKLLLCFTLSTITLLPAQQGQSKPYKSEYFNLRYPSTWKIVQQDETSLTLGDDDPHNPMYQLIIGVNPDAPRDPASLDKEFGQMCASAAKAFKAEFSLNEPVKAPGMITLASCTLKRSPDPLTMMTSFQLLNNGQVGYITVLTIAGTVEKAGKIIQSKVLYSLEWNAWRTYDGPNFSLEYPPDWNTDGSGATFKATDPADPSRWFGIEFLSGVRNQTGVLTQCGSVSDVVTAWFNRYRAAHEWKDPADAMNRSTVTFDHWTGHSMEISQVEGGGFKHPQKATLVSVHALTRQNGVYLVLVSGPPRPLGGAQELFEQHFSTALQTKGQRLPSTEYCNY